MESATRYSYDIRPTFLLIAVVTILLLPIQWIIAWAIAVSVHELCHILSLRLTGVRILHVRLEYMGAIIETEPMQPMQELICAIFGPVGGFSLVLLAQVWPEIALCAFVQSLFNLLPFYPLDGGRALHNLAILLSDRSLAAKITRAVNLTILILIAVIAVISEVQYRSGAIPALLAVLLFFKYRKINYFLQTNRSNSTI